MKILITGGAGFLGSNLTKRLLDAGHQVLVVDNLTTGSSDNLREFGDNPNFEFHKMGIEEDVFMALCESHGNKFDRIYDLACPTGVPNIETLGDEMIAACSTGMINVLEVAKKSGARMLFTSSSEVYGEPLVTPQSEEYTGNVETLGFRANYEEGKRFAETLLAHYVKSKGVDAVMVRLFNAYGPNMGISDTRVISAFICSALNNKPLPVQGDGSQSRTLCYVTDILDGFEAVMTRGEKGKVYNLGSDKSITVKEFAELVIEMTNSNSTIGYTPRPEHDHSSRMPVLEKIRGLGWNNNIDLTTGLKETIENFKERLAARELGYAVSETIKLEPQLQS